MFDLATKSWKRAYGYDNTATLEAKRAGAKKGDDDALMRGKNGQRGGARKGKKGQNVIKEKIDVSE